MKTRFLLPLIALAAISVFTAPGASGAVTMGSDLSKIPADGVACGSTCTWIQSELPGRVTSAPTDGVIVRWRIRTNAASGPYALQIARPAGGNVRLGVTVSDAVSAVDAGISEFPTRLPIKAGDNIGIKWDVNNTAFFHPGIAVPGALALYFIPALANLETRLPNVANTNVEFLVNADLEADADGDGFGDETQDQCVGRAGEFAGCPDQTPPKLSTTVGKRQSIAKLAGTVSIDELGRVDARATVSFKVGKRTVLVRTKLIKRALSPNVKSKLNFKFNRAQRKRLQTQLNAGKKLTARINFAATDLVGNKSTAKKTVRLKK